MDILYTYQEFVLRFFHLHKRIEGLIVSIPDKYGFRSMVSVHHMVEGPILVHLCLPLDQDIIISVF